MYYLEKQINGGEWFAMLKAEDKAEIVSQISVLRQNELTIHDYTENTFYIPELKTKYRIVDTVKMKLLFDQLGHSI